MPKLSYPKLDKHLILNQIGNQLWRVFSFVVGGMLASCGKKIKIFRTVVISYFIKMMDYFFFIKESAKSFFSNKNMFSDIATLGTMRMMRRKNLDVAIAVDSPPSPILSFISSFSKQSLSSARGFLTNTERVSALFRTKSMFPSSLFGVSGKFFSAIIAIKNRLVKSFPMFILPFVGALFRAISMLTFIKSILKSSEVFITSVASSLNDFRFFKRKITRLRAIVALSVFKFPKRNVELLVAPLASAVFTSLKHKVL